MNIFLSDKNRLVQRIAHGFCEIEIQPIAGKIDKEAHFPWDVVKKMGELGYFGIQAPKSLGGAALDTVDYILIIEEISKSCAALGLCVAVHNSVALYPLLAFGSEEQKKKWAPQLTSGNKIGAFCLTEPNAGSDASGIESEAISKDRYYVINGSKAFVTNGGVAGIYLIFARTNPNNGNKGISVLIVERGTPGLIVGDLEELCGVRANPVSSVRLNDCEVPSQNLLGREGAGLSIGFAALDIGRIGIAAQAAGIARAALEEAIRYSKQRHQFGVPIAKHQALSMMIADMATKVDAARLMAYRAATLRDKGESFSQASAMAKLFSSEISSEVTDQALQIHGGYGYSKSYPVERYYRDARVTRIYEGTSEVHKMVIARGIMGN